ncbi:MAG: ThiF family adenylyltransferase [Patescibacteria group bacterium]
MTEYKPIFLKENQIGALRKKYPNIIEVDAFSRQIKELFLIKKIKHKEDDFVYVFYPWNYHLVKTIKAQDYFKLKTNRNQDLITHTEQIKLAGCRVAVLGMSVGSNIAFVLTQAGISNEITVADFDGLDTTNLNRIFAGVHQIGLNKTIIAARHIYEDNPFAKVNLLEKGVNEKILEKLLKEKKLDIIIEEIDDMAMKIKIRVLARKYKIPVIMITDNGDGVVLHVERYDLGHKKIFGKDQFYWNKILSEKMTKDRAGMIIMNDIVGGPDRVDKKMLFSVGRVLKGELVSWSQLGSAAMLGGVVATVFLKRIILNENSQKDIRYYFNIPNGQLQNHEE